MTKDEERLAGIDATECRQEKRRVPMMGWDDGWGAGSWLGMSLMMVMMVAFWAGIIALVVWLVRSAAPRQASPQSPPVGPMDRADEVLAERFARGEIDEEEFTRRRELLHRQ